MTSGLLLSPGVEHSGFTRSGAAAESTLMKNRSTDEASPGEGSASRESVLLTSTVLQRALTRIAHEIAERNEDSSQVALVGIQAGGVPLASRLARCLETIWHHPVPQGSIDISMHRDDLNQRGVREVLPTQIPFDITGRTVVLVDDVLYSGRTVRAAMDSLNDFGRPARIQLAALVDRGFRELPIKADFVGKNVPTARTESIRVRLQETHGVDEVVLERGAARQ